MAANRRITTTVSRKLYDEAKALSMLRGMTLEAYVKAAIEDYTERCITNPRGENKTMANPCRCGETTLEAAVSCGQGMEPVFHESTDVEEAL